MKLSYAKNQQGTALVSIMLMLPSLLIIAAVYVQLSASSFRIAMADQTRINAQLATDAGIDIAMDSVNNNGNWTGTGSEITLRNDNGVRTTYEVNVIPVDADNKILKSVGRAYRPSTDSAPTATVKVETTLRPVRAGDYSIVTGVGGLKLSNSAKIIGGNVLVNGTITMSNTSQIGLTTNPVNVEVANQACPVIPDATYPRICAPGEGGQPVSISNEAHIYANVKANGQTSKANMSNPGLTASYGVETQALPPHDRAAQKAAVSVNRTGTDASCDTNNGTKTWAANTKITGDVNVGKNCKIILQGNVWITGNIKLSNSAQLIVGETLGTTRPTVMVDGKDTEFSNTSKISGNSVKTGIQLISYWSNTTCSPNCTDVTGTNLYNSRGITTIQLKNQASGPESIFYSRWTQVEVSNGGQIGALVGQTVNLTNSSTITFGSSAGIPEQTYWVIDTYRRVF